MRMSGMELEMISACLHVCVSANVLTTCMNSLSYNIIAMVK